jgi:hypothetical protein
MLDVSVAYEKYKFLGYEFLTWLWFMCENDQESLRGFQPEMASLDVGNRLVLENRQTGAVETITIKGDDAGLEEARLALQKGGMVSEVNMVYQAGDQKWQFTVKGESLHIGNLKVPETGPMETEDDWEGAILEKTYLYEKAVLLIRQVYRGFILSRIQNEWSSKMVPQMKSWISGSKG